MAEVLERRGSGRILMGEDGGGDDTQVIGPPPGAKRRGGMERRNGHRTFRKYEGAEG